MKQLFGGILLAIGILIAGASGLCSLVVLFSPGEFSGFGMLPAVALFGGPPIAIGVGLAFGGRHLIRQARAEKPDDVSDIFE
jgi:hypothetical protein